MPLPLSRTSHVPVSVTIKPANNVPGSFEYQTDTHALLRLLRQKTDLSGYALDSFQTDLELSTQGSLRAVDLKDEVLREIGYFID